MLHLANERYIELQTFKNINDMNKKEILALKSVNGLLNVVRIPVEDSSFIIKELENAVNNPNKTLMDLQSLFLNSFHPILEYYNYTFPYTYCSSYISGATKPKNLSYAEYQTMLTKDIAAKINNKTTEEIEEIKKTQDAIYKYNFYNQAARFIQQQQIYKAFQKAQNDSDVKMYSRESIGWSGFEYKITDDVKACVNTNFGYGYACYFTLTIAYKGIVIAPFSHVVKYYNANMTDIIRCTRDYNVSSDSWNPAFDFVKEFANQSLQNPQKFAESYLMNEIHEMMSGLRNIMSNPNGVINMFKRQNKNLSDYHTLCLISPMSDDEKRRFEVFPSEMPVVFKAEKIHESYNMLQRLKEIGEILPEVNNYVSEIVSMINKQTPEINRTMNAIKNDIKGLQTQKELRAKTLESLEEKMDIHEKTLELLITKLPKGASYPEKLEVREEYAQKHPNYTQLKMQINNLSDEISELGSKIYSRERLITRLESCLCDVSAYSAAA